MQSPFKHRPSDDFARRDADDTRWEGRDQRYDEGSSWSEGDGGRTARAFGNQSRDNDDRRYSGSGDWGSGQDRQGEYGRGSAYGGDRGVASNYDRPDYRSQSGYGRNGAFGQDRYGQDQYGQGRYGQDRDGRSTNRGDYDQSYGRGDRGGYDDGRSAGGQSYGQGGGRTRHDFEPDYLHWREQQMTKLDQDYSDWRSERREKFSSDFDSWRQNRSANPIVGNVADGGVGDGKDAKKS